MSASQAEDCSLQIQTIMTDKSKEGFSAMNFRSIMVLFILALASISAFAQEQPSRMVIAIGDFKNKTTGDEELFRTLIDRMTNSIMNTRKFDVVDQARLKEVLDQHKLADSGMSEQADAPKKGKISSAGYKIYGTVLNLGLSQNTVSSEGLSGEKITAEVELNLRFADVETGKLVASKIIKASKMKSQTSSEGNQVASNMGQTVIQDAIQDASEKVTNTLMELAFPTKIIKIGASDITVNLPQERAKKGQLFSVFFLGEELTDPDTGESLGAEETKEGEIEITETMPKFSKAVPVGGIKLEKFKEGMIVRPISQEEIEERKEKAKSEAKKEFKKRF